MPNSTIADFMDFQNGFLDRSFRGGIRQTPADLGFYVELFDAFGITFLSSFVFTHAFGPGLEVKKPKSL